MSHALTLPGLAWIVGQSAGGDGRAGAREAAADRMMDEGRTTEPTDEMLLERYRTGDAAAFRTLIERHQDALLRFLIRFMGNRQAAEDVFQDAFLQVHLSADSFDVTRRFKPWLFTIAANKGRDFRRKAVRRSALELSAPVGGGGENGGGQSFVDLMQVDVDAPSDHMDTVERDALVQSAIDAMPEHLREILLLSYFQRVPYAAIAEALDIPLGTVKSRLHSAVASFAKQWERVSAEWAGREKPGARKPG